MHAHAAIQAKIDALPRRSLAFYPTPLHKLERLSGHFGVNLYMKRDDLSGRGSFGGNKMRKLEFLIGDAIAQGCDTVVTFGAAQSNHAMQTVCACRACGLSPVLFLTTVVDFDPQDVRANMLVNEIMGAEMHLIPPQKGSVTDAFKRTQELAAKRIGELEADGRKVYVIPVGGTTSVGCVGFANAVLELCGQMDALEISPDFIAHSTGSGGTMAGLVAGKALTQTQAAILSFSAFNPGGEEGEHAAFAAGMANSVLEQVGVPQRVGAKDCTIDQNYFAPGYELPNDLTDEAIKLLAREEGILVDPVYSGKALAGLFDYIHKGTIAPGSNVVFWHTGGVVALFAEKEILGNIRN
ncbi:D-cysteine desulfhydrase family protein [Desulfovibrio sp. OttesenSCG-928-G15]|nr:D-cysteine desulfhydrase family protein [Desulfovibrio sp. OttesenSCG-928-G15]